MTTVGPYHLEALVGRGATGEVWRAVRPGPVPQVVAIKRAPAGSDPGGEDRLRREAEVLAELDHPHIVRILDVLDDGDGLAVVMPLARGGSLHDLVEERGRLRPEEAVAVLAPVADALGSAHRRGVLHGDVKPANVLFTTDGEPLLADFGVARHLRRPEPAPAGEVGTRPVEGTAGYVDPELVSTGRPEAGNDLYGLAVLGYLCLTARLPHTGTTAEEILAAADAGDHPSLADDPAVPRALAEVVEAALARDPARRPPAAAALARALRSALPPGTPVLPGPSRPAVPSAPRLLGTMEPAGAPVPGGGLASLAGQSGPGPGPGPFPGTRAFGPRPPAPEPPARRMARPVLVAAAAILFLGAVVGAVAVGPGGGDDRVRDAPPPAPEAGRPPATAAPCPDRPPATVQDGAQVLVADLLGTGCPMELVWDGRILSVHLDPAEARPRRYELVPRRGGAGQLVVGDWDCDGSQTPGYYQPATGLISYFGAVPDHIGEEMSALTRSSGVRDGRATVATGPRGCDVVEVAPRA